MPVVDPGRALRSCLAGERTRIVDLQRAKLGRVNSWNLVDASARGILGAFRLDRERGELDRLAASGELWLQRVAMIATYAFIRESDFRDALRIAGRLRGSGTT